VILPKMSGRELYQALTSVQPTTRVLYMSGYANDAVLRSGVLERHTAFLQKPFGLSALVRKVRDTLDSIEPMY